MEPGSILTEADSTFEMQDDWKHLEGIIPWEITRSNMTSLRARFCVTLDTFQDLPVDGTHFPTSRDLVFALSVCIHTPPRKVS